MRKKVMSLRSITKELEISPAYLSYMINGKQPWRRNLYQRYLGVVTGMGKVLTMMLPTRKLEQRVLVATTGCEPVA